MLRGLNLVPFVGVFHFLITGGPFSCKFLNLSYTEEYRPQILPEVCDKTIPTFTGETRENDDSDSDD